jgi:hypothetical protein
VRFRGQGKLSDALLKRIVTLNLYALFTLATYTALSSQKCQRECLAFFTDAITKRIKLDQENIRPKSPFESCE